MLKQKNSCFFVAFLVVQLLYVAGCNKSEPPPPVTPKATAPVKPAVQKQHSSVAKVQTPGTSVQGQLSSAKRDQTREETLVFAGKKDPFKPAIVEQKLVKSAAIPGVPVGEGLPIQSYDVLKFRVTGIIAGLKENRALVVDPAGKGYVIRPGMPIGNNSGYVSKITPSSIEVVEQFREDNGRVRKRTIKLTLFQKSKEAAR